MAEFATLLLKADTTGLERGKKVLDETTRAGARTEKAVGGTERGFVRAGRGAGQATTQIKGFNSAADQTRAMALAATKVLAGLTASFASVRAVGAASQAYARISNSLRALGVDAAKVPAQIEAIGDIAQRTRAPLEATAQLYQRISIAGKDLGASQQQVLRFTENVGLALAQQGGSAEQASGALLQLSQAMAGGVVRAEEFNSLLEGAFPVAQAAANAIDGAAGSVGKLRQMVVDGEISSREFFDAILSSSEALEASFGTTVPTISQAMSVLSTSFTLFTGQLDTSVGASATLATGIIFLAENFERVASYAAAAAVGFGGAYVIGVAAAAASTATLSGALIFLRTALIRTGIGALVVAAGEMVYQFSRLVKGAGGFGNALSLLGGVASEVWQRIGMGVDFVTQSVAAMSANVQAFFIGAIRSMAGAFVEFTNVVADGLNSLFGTSLTGASATITQELGMMQIAAEDAGAAATAAAKVAADGFSAPLKSVKALQDAVTNTTDALEGGANATESLNNALDDTGGAGGSASKAAKALEKVKTEAEAYNDALKEAALTSEDIGTQKANIMISGIDGVANAFGDFIGRGLTSFKDFAKSILSSFTGMISQMIALAAKQRIMFSMGITASGVGGAAQAAGAPGGGGILGGLGGKMLGGFGDAGSIFGLGGLGGGTGLLGGFGNAVSGGLGNVFSMGANAAAAGGGFMATLGAAVPVLGAVGLAISFFRKKVTELDTGLRITADTMETVVEDFRKTNTKRFWGLSSKDRMTYSEAENAGPVKDAIDAIKDQAMSLGGVLGLTAANFASFSSQIQISLKGLSEEQAQAEIQRAFGVMAEQFSYAALGSFQEQFGNIIREGETAQQTLQNLANSLQLTNSAFETLGFTLFETSVQGAAAAREFADALGGLDALASKTSAYYQRFYTDAERVGNLTDDVREAMADLGLVLPSTIEGFRALVDQAARMGDMERVGSLIDLSGAFAAMLDGQGGLADAASQSAAQAQADATRDLQAAFAREQASTRDAFAEAIGGLQSSLTGARERLATSRAIADAIKGALNGRIFPSIEAQRQSQDRAADYLRSLVGMGQINDVDALRDALSAVSNPSADTYSTLEDYRRDFNLTSGVIKALEQTAGNTLTADEQAVKLLEQQIEDMEEQSNKTLELLQAQLDALIGVSASVQSLGGAIAAFQVAQAAAQAANRGPIEQIYQDVLGRSPDAKGLNFYQGLLNSGQASISQIRADIAQSNEARTGVIPSYAVGTDYHPGGLAMVGERGPELVNLPRGSSVSTVSQTSRMFDNSELVAELRELRAEVSQLKAINVSIARSTNKSALIAEKHDEIGTPGTAVGQVVKTEAA